MYDKNLIWLKSNNEVNLLSQFKIVAKKKYVAH